MNANPSDLFEGALEESLDESTLAVFLIVLAAFAVIVLLVLVAYYVINSLSLYRLAKQLNVENAFLAWIPYANYFIMGRIVEKCDERRRLPVHRWSLIVLLTMIGAVAISTVLSTVASLFAAIPVAGAIIGAMISLLSMLLSGATLAMDCICRWKIYREYYSETAKIILVVVGAVCSVQPIITLITSFREPLPIENEYVESAESVIQA